MASLRAPLYDAVSKSTRSIVLYNSHQSFERLTAMETTMIFEFESQGQTSTLRAIFELGDKQTGERQEGHGQEITYSGEEITFDCAVQSIHPDLLGLLCLIIFYPFIGHRVVFPVPVSPRLEAAFKRPNFGRVFRFANVDPKLDKYSGSKMALSFGGGIDSSAIRVMFPDAYVVHEAHLRQGRLVPSHTHEIVRSLGPDMGKIVTTNQRYVSYPGGWHGWTCAFATSLLLATDYDFGIILMGSTLANTLLYNGTRYWNRFRARKRHGVTGNFWQSAFNEVGIPVFSPVCGVSEYVTMQLSLDLVHSGDVVYCMEHDGKACLRCTKCFRRDVIRAVLDSDYLPDWEPYDREYIHEFLERKPLYYGHTFCYARDRVENLPMFVVDRLAPLPAIRSEWPMRVHTGTFEFCDPEWRMMIRERVLAYLEPMERKHVKEMEGWDLVRPPGRLDGPVRGLQLATDRFLTRLGL